MIKRVVVFLFVLVAIAAAYIWFVTTWSYSSGERAGWVQKFSNKGWVCKTWEGELALVSLPGSTTEKFFFTVHDAAVARDIQQAMGKRVALHYEEKVGIPTACFGDTRYFVNKVTLADEISLSPGVVVSTPQAAPVVPAVPAAPAPAASAPK